MTTTTTTAAAPRPRGRQARAVAARGLRRLRASALWLVIAATSGCRNGPPVDAVPPDAAGEPAVAPAQPAEPAEYARPEARAIWTAARARGVDFRGIGQEPGWTVEIYEGDRIEFVGDYGDLRVVTPAPPPETPAADERTYYRVRTDAHTLEIVIEARPCQDVMSGEPFPAAVRVVLDGRAYDGCGRVP